MTAVDAVARTSAWRGTAVVDLAAIRGNLASLRQVTGSAQLMAVVKADAYGHGAVPVARAARDAGAEWLGVAFLGEAMQLRESGDTGPLLAWLVIPGEPGLSEAIEADVDLGVGSKEALQAIADSALGRRARVHLKIDTGLGRGGSTATDWPELLDAAVRLRDRVDVVGLMSHLACADVPDDPSIDAQRDAFADACTAALAAGLEPRVRHLSSSGSAMTRPDTHAGLVRIGISMYGLTPGPAVGPPWPAPVQLTPAMTLRGHVALAKRVPAGQGVSYGLAWRAPRETTLALIPLGYADGLPRTAREPWVSIDGRRMPIVGRVAMDQVVVDAGEHDVRAGDEVILFSPGANGEPTVQDWADWSGTIGYEIVTRIGPRVPRTYVGA